MLILLVLHGQNPKTEARDPKEGRNPKSDNRKTQQALPGPRLVRASGFGLRISGFGLRISALPALLESTRPRTPARRPWIFHGRRAGIGYPTA